MTFVLVAFGIVLAGTLAILLGVFLVWVVVAAVLAVVLLLYTRVLAYFRRPR